MIAARCPFHSRPPAASVSPPVKRAWALAWPPPNMLRSLPPVTPARRAISSSTTWIEAPVSKTNGTGSAPFTRTGMMGWWVRKSNGISCVGPVRRLAASAAMASRRPAITAVVVGRRAAAWRGELPSRTTRVDNRQSAAG